MQMPQIQISVKGIAKLLKSLNPHKAAGPDQFKPIVLQTLHAELAPILQVIFQKSLDSGKLSHIWKEANVSPIFKKGDKSDPTNYRPISLTCVLCKVLERLNIWLIPTYYLRVTGQLVPKSTRTRVNSYPSWSTRTHFLVNSYLPSQLVPVLVNSYPFSHFSQFSISLSMQP